MKMFRYVLMIFLACSLAMLGGCSPKPESTVENFFEAVSKGETDKAVALFSMTGAGDEQTVALFKSKLPIMIGEMKKQMDEKGGLKSVNITKSEVSSDGNTAHVDYTITYGKGGSDAASKGMDLVKEDGQWKIKFGKE
ncbi:MAG: DUF4878 domain-containing protein [Gallionellaceae bacterium]|jgi:stress response protein SCP2|nr:DUF4878 domain-containing protein [Gallionellaceae bacterium]